MVKNYGKFDQTVVGKLGPGDVFGEMALIMEKARTATVVAAEDSVLLEIRMDNFEDIIGNHPELALAIMRALCKRIDSLNSRVRSRV